MEPAPAAQAPEGGVAQGRPGQIEQTARAGKLHIARAAAGTPDGAQVHLRRWGFPDRVGGPSGVCSATDPDDDAHRVRLAPSRQAKSTQGDRVLLREAPCRQGSRPRPTLSLHRRRGVLAAPPIRLELLRDASSRSHPFRKRATRLPIPSSRPPQSFRCRRTGHPTRIGTFFTRAARNILPCTSPRGRPRASFRAGQYSGCCRGSKPDLPSGARKARAPASSKLNSAGA